MGYWWTGGAIAVNQRFVTSMRKTESNVFNPLHRSGRFGTLCESPEISKGSFNNYVDKMRGGGSQKMSVFVHAQGIKPVHVGEGGSKNVKILST